jgi:glycosyltransferase involved in cell wall biosynthesis
VPSGAPAFDLAPAMTAITMRAILVDPLLFTAPYDAALTQGLLAAGVEPLWATRPSRWGDQDEIPRQLVEELFYRHVDSIRLPGLLKAMVKAIAHAVGLVRLVRRVRTLRPDVVHFQWLIVPALDRVAIWFIRHYCPVVLTVHDPVPVRTYGKALSAVQALGLNAAIRSADRVIVHTTSGKQTLIGNGIAAERIVEIAHGPLRLSVAQADIPARDARWTFVLFGELKPYKGLEVLIDAVAKIPAALTEQSHVIIAGRSCMDVRHIEASIAQAGVGATIELRLWRHSETQMAELFARTDTFLFPYRNIDASGVYYLVKSLGKWLIASRVGIFSQDIAPPAGVLVAPGDSDQLAQAMASAIAERPAGVARGDDQSWHCIASLTQATYLATLLPGKAIGTPQRAKLGAAR